MGKVLGKIEAHWGAFKFKADANRCAEEIRTLGEGFAPSDVVKLARNEESELHKCFTWDDTVAAEKYRNHEARIVMANLKITYIKPDKEPVKTDIRVFYGSKTERNQYKSTEMIIEQVDEHQRLLKQAKEELNSFKKRYEMLSELSEIFDLIDTL